MAVSSRPRVLSCVSALLSLLFGFLGCSSAASRPSPLTTAHQGTPAPAVAKPAPPTAAAAQPEVIFPVMLGIDVLENEGFAAIKGKRIGLLTHPAGVNRRGVSTIDVLRRAPGVKLVALFGVEHGIYGDLPAGQNYPDHIDKRTGLRVFSLFTGRTHKPTRTQLKGLDALVIDLQDIGVRSYTYASAMKLAMEGCFENGVEVIVLDRPNPLGGLKVDGPPLDAEWMSYVGEFRVPYVHGLTIGELALMAAKAPGVLAVSDAVRQRGRLIVVPMRGWRRAMRWPETGLTFVPTSPYVPDFAACVGYAMTGLGCYLGGFRHGIGDQYPFRGVSHLSIRTEVLERELTALRLPGLQFRRVSVPGKNGKPATGIYIEVVDWDAWHPTELSFYLMKLACKLEPRNPFATASQAEANGFLRHMGSTAFFNALTHDGAKVDVESFLAEWRRRAQVYQQQTRRYWLYPE
ncbi:MAG TPA: DUF1343 domain-containing protein [Opitutaceae bacterium]|nr:DUF1343 domain-containing protein [Opitutaceae bacterium]